MNRSDISFHHISYFLTLWQRWIFKLYQYYSRHPTARAFETIQNEMDDVVHDLFDKNFRNTSLICFDWNDSYFTKAVVNFARAINIPTVALPHGDEPYWNTIQKDNEINYKSTLDDNLQEEMFDYVAVPNKLCSRRYSFMPEKVKTLGSPRYCSEWLPIHDTIKPKLRLGMSPVFVQSNTKFPLKIVLFTRNKHWPINWPELKNIINLVAQFKPILIIKGHPRGAIQEQLSFDNPHIIIDYDNISNSSTLIDWADIVLDVGTSVTWEAIQKQKPLLMLDYICGNQTTVSQYIPGLSITCRDDLFEHMRKFTKNHQRNIYKEHQRQKFIREMIEKDDQTLNNYCNFLEGLIDDKSETKT
jgi:hypothetical protein